MSMNLKSPTSRCQGSWFNFEGARGSLIEEEKSSPTARVAAEVFFGNFGRPLRLEGSEQPWHGNGPLGGG